MDKKLINSQLTNFTTYQMYLRQMLALARNVFIFENLFDYAPNIDKYYLNTTLVNRGAIAFFQDEILGLLALPFRTLGKLDLYNNPVDIEVYGYNNNYHRILKKGEYIIMYDNNGRYPINLDIFQYAERVALDTRTADLNVGQQKTNRFFKTPQNKEKSVRDLINRIDGFENAIITYDGFDIEDVQICVEPAPYVADKIDMHKEKDWNEFLRLIGISNMNFQKKERNIKDEVQASQGGTIASRFSRFEPRKDAIDRINEKWGTDIQVSYFDKMPTTTEDEEVDNYDLSMDDSI